MADTAKVLDPQVKERLDRIDWGRLKEKTGITREQIEKNPKVAKQLVYGGMTDFVSLGLSDVRGEVSLRAYPTPKDSGKLWPVLAYGKEEKKSEDQKLFYRGEEIYSKTAKKNLFEMTAWNGGDGERKYGRANASTGIPVSIAPKKRDEDGNIIYKKDDKGKFVLDEKGQKVPEREEKISVILSIHPATQHLCGITVDKLKERFKAGAEMYGVKLDEKQIDAIAKGGAVILKGCKNSQGEAFDTFPGIGTPVQFDVSQNCLVPVHPIALKEVLKMGPAQGAAEAEKKVEKTAAKRTQSKKETPKEAPVQKNRMKR